MPLGTREVLVAIRARDVTSRVLREIGTNFGHLSGAARTASMSMFNAGAALTAVGVGMGAIGAAGLKFFDDAIDSFIEYSRQAALTRTQVDQLGVSVGQIADIGERVAAKIPAPFNEMQDALFDIFSSMDVNLMEAEGLLELFAKGAVAGQTDIRTAARSTISVMNAYKKPFTEAGDVMDIMFEMVRKGVGTYEEFNVAIGRAIPAAVSASQEFDTLAAVMAFLTRQGLSTQMAATSAARAMELFTNPDVTEALRGIGVEVVDAHGNFRQLNDIILELANSEGWAKMGSAERKKMFKDIFGTGTIQARRFFDTAIPNFRDLNTLTDITSSSAGELGQAYETMFAEPAMQAQLLANKYEILRVEIGEKLLPAKIRLMEVASKLIDWWNGLSDSTRTLAIRVAAGTAAFMLIAGAVITALGAFMMISAILGPLGITMASLGMTIAALMAAVAVGVAVFKAFGGGIQGLIAGVSAGVLAFIALGAAFGAISAAVTGVGFALSPLVLIIAAIAAAVLAAVIIWKNWDTIKELVGKVVDRIKDAWEWFTNLSLAGKILVGIITALIAPFILVIAAIVAIIKNFDTIVDAAKGVFEWFTNLHMAGKILIGVILAIVAPFLIIAAAVVALVKNWKTVVEWAGNLVNAAKAVFDWFMNLGTIFRLIAAVVAGIMGPFIGAIAMVIALGKAIASNWNTIKGITVAVWSVIVDAVDTAWSLFKSFWNWLTNIDVDVWGTIKDAAVTAWNAITTVVMAAVNFIVDRWNNLISIGTTIWSAISSAVSAAASAMLSALKTVWGWLSTAYNWFVDNFGDNFAEIWKTISTEVSDVSEEIMETLSSLWADFKKFGERVAGLASFVWGEIQFAWDNITTGTNELWKAFQFAWDRIKPILEFLGKVAITKIMPLVVFLREVVVAVFGALAAGIGRARDLIADILSALVITFKFTWDVISNIVTTAFNLIRSVIEAGVRIVVSLWENFGSILLKPIKIVWDVISATFIAGIKVISNVIQFFLNLIQGDWGEAWQNVVDVFGAIWDHLIAMIKAGIESAIFLFKTLPGAVLGFLGDLVGILFDLGKDIITGLINGMKDLLPKIGEFILRLGPMLLLLLEDAGMLLYVVGKDLLQGLIDGAASVWDSIFEFISNTISDFIQAFKDFFGISSPSTVMAEIGVNIIQGLLDGIKAAWELVTGWLGGLLDLVLGFFSGAPSWLLEKGKEVFRGLMDGFKKLWHETIEPWAYKRKMAILDFFNGVLSWLLEKGKDVFRGLLSGFKWLWENSIINWLFDRKNAILGFFSGALNWLLQKGKDIFNGLWSGFKNGWTIISGWLTGADGGGGIKGRLLGIFGGAVNWLVQAGKNIITGLKNGIKNVVDNIKDWISDRVDTIVDAFKSFFGISSPSTVMAEVGKNFILGFMEGVVTQAKNIPALISKIGMGLVDMLKYLGLDILGGIGDFISGATTGNITIEGLMKSMAAELGWTGGQWDALRKLIMNESGFNPNAQNPTSSAYGLFQFLDSTWAGTGIAKTSDPVQQIIAGFRYISARYGNPLNAWNFWQSNSPHWYAKGSWDVPYTGLAGIHKGEMIIPKTFASQLRDVMGGSGGRGASFNFYGDVTFGSDMNRATSDLDFWTRSQNSGV